MLHRMTPQLSSRILVFLSIAFGIAIAVLAVFGSDAVGTVAFIGAMALGLLWVGRAFFVKGSNQPD